MHVSGKNISVANLLLMWDKMETTTFVIAYACECRKQREFVVV